MVFYSGVLFFFREKRDETAEPSLGKIQLLGRLLESGMQDGSGMASFLVSFFGFSCSKKEKKRDIYY